MLTQYAVREQFLYGPHSRALLERCHSELSPVCNHNWCNPKKEKIVSEVHNLNSSIHQLSLEESYSNIPDFTCMPSISRTVMTYIDICFANTKVIGKRCIQQLQSLVHWDMRIKLPMKLLAQRAHFSSIVVAIWRNLISSSKHGAGGPKSSSTYSMNTYRSISNSLTHNPPVDGYPTTVYLLSIWKKVSPCLEYSSAVLRHIPSGRPA